MNYVWVGRGFLFCLVFWALLAVALAHNPEDFTYEGALRNLMGEDYVEAPQPVIDPQEPAPINWRAIQRRWEKREREHRKKVDQAWN